LLAYVFWHWPQPQVDVSEYETRLRDFQKTLRDHPPPGFRDSVVFRVGGMPWIQAERGYEDWYLVEGSVALDPLNDAAIAPACRAAAANLPFAYCSFNHFLPKPVFSSFSLCTACSLVSNTSQ